VLPAAIVAFLIRSVTAAPQVNFPISLQLPPVAVVGDSYSFQFAPTTFQPDSNKLQYSLVGHPPWLHLNSSNRTLWGSPGEDDVGIATFTIAAAGEAGAVANMETKLLVREDKGPSVAGNISQQLSKSGPLSGPTSIVLLPSKPFEIKFTPDTFQSNGKALNFHATLGDHTPLPAWMSFDEQSLRLAGTTPPSAAVQSFDIILIASDTPGFAAASISFTLVVSNHQLLFKPLSQTISLSKGAQVDITGLKDKLFLDNTTIKDDDIESTSADLPSWLSFNNRSFEVSGQAPSGLMSQDFSIIVKDIFGDSAVHTVHVVFTSQLFTAEVGQLNITLGEPIEYNIPKSVLTHDDEIVSADFGDLQEWLHFDPDTLSIRGTVPESFGPHSVEGSITATSSNGTLTDTQTFQLQLVTAGSHLNPTKAPTDSESTQAGANDNHSNGRPMSQRKRAGIVIGSVVSGLFAAIILLSLFCLFCGRKKEAKGYLSPKVPRSPRKTDISRPIPITEEWADVDKANDVDLEKGEADDFFERTPDHPPQIALALTSKRKDSQSPTSSIAEIEDKMLAEFNRSSWGFQDEAGPSHHPHESMKIPTEMLRGESLARSPLRYKRRTTQVYRDSQRRTSGLPINRRITGLGHGRHTYSPSRSTNNFSLFRRHLSSSTYTTATNSMSMLSTVPSALPQPPTARHTTQLTTPAEKRRSIRVVAASTCESLLDRRTYDEKRSSYFRKRASAKREFPFFGAGSSRVSSSSYKSPPAFISESSPTTRNPFTQRSTNIAKPTPDSASEQSTGGELPESLRIRKPTDTPSPNENFKYPGSLRKNRNIRNFMRRHTEAPPGPPPGPVEDPPVRPDTTGHSSIDLVRRTSTGHSLRGPELRSTINDLTGESIFDDREVSESEYSQEDDDIEEFERRQTIKTGQFTLPPLNISYGKPKCVSKRGSQRDSKRKSKRDSKGELKRTSERDSTPYSLALEHGGKENYSSTYNLNDALTFIAPTTTESTTAAPRTKAKAKANLSPERPKTAIGPRSRDHSGTQFRATKRHSSSQRNGYGRPLSRVDSTSTKERHSRKSIHSHTQSRCSLTAAAPAAAAKKQRDHSRTQSSAYPHFDAVSEVDTSKTGIDADTITTSVTTRPRQNTFERDDAGNILHYESPKIEQLDRNSIGVCTSNHRVVTSSGRSSKLAQLHTSPFYHSKRDTAIHSYQLSSSPPPSNPQHQSVGLGLTLVAEDSGNVGRASNTPARESGRRSRGRTPLSVLDDGNGASAANLRVVEGKGKRPVSVEVEEGQGGNMWGSKGWGSLRGMLGRSGGSIWGKGDTAFV